MHRTALAITLWGCTPDERDTTVESGAFVQEVYAQGKMADVAPDEVIVVVPAVDADGNPWFEDSADSDALMSVGLLDGREAPFAPGNACCMVDTNFDGQPDAPCDYSSLQTYDNGSELWMSGYWRTILPNPVPAVYDAKVTIWTKWGTEPRNYAIGGKNPRIEGLDTEFSPGQVVWLCHSQPQVQFNPNTTKTKFKEGVRVEDLETGWTAGPEVVENYWIRP